MIAGHLREKKADITRRVETTPILSEKKKRPK